MLSPSYLLISVLGNQKEALEQGSTATFWGKKHTGFLLLIFFNTFMNNRYGLVVTFYLAPQAILGAFFFSNKKAVLRGGKAIFCLKRDSAWPLTKIDPR